MSIQIVVQKGRGFVYPTNRIKGIESLYSLLRDHEKVVAALGENERTNVFYTVASHLGSNTGALPVRTRDSFEAQTVIPFDIDGVDPSKAMEYAAVLADMVDTPIEAITVVSTGSGVHLLIALLTPIRSIQYFEKNKRFYKHICVQLLERLHAKGLKCDKIDSVVFEPARVLRLPGTTNVKPGKTTQCTLVHLAEKAVQFDIAERSGLPSIEQKHVPPAELRASYPTPDFKYMVSECLFLKQAQEKPETIHEPDFFAAASLLGHVAEQDEAKALAKKIFDGATQSASLQASDFDTKYKQAKLYGGQKCSTINTLWGKCHECPHFTKVPIPLALKSKDHISSAANGYWIVNRKGERLRPNYGDLRKVFESEIPYKVLAKTGRILIYNGKYYEEQFPLQTKAWMQNKMEPQDEVVEHHRNEFLNTVKINSPLGEAEITEFLTTRTLGKLNCKNGVLDIRTGELLEHTPEIGFLNVLPYDYQPLGQSDYFFDWLETVMGGNDDHIQTLLDVLGWILVPTVDEHVFVYLTGEGGNGKSTFLAILKALVGEGNYSAVNVKQLCNNRFAPIALEGKFMNISEESSGTTLTTEELNFIKNAASGGDIQVEAKGQQGYMMRNGAKLVFSANRIPHFQDNDRSIRRRLVVIPFDYKIQNEDSRIQDRLVAEVPYIMSMVIRMLRENLARNGGKFKIHRGGAAGVKAQAEFLGHGNTALQWARDHIESDSQFSEENYVPVSEAYAKYDQWCETNGHKAMNKNNFSRALHIDFLCMNESVIRKIGQGKDAKSTRVFRRTKWKKDAVE